MKNPLALLVGAAVLAAVGLAGATVDSWQHWMTPFETRAASPEIAMEGPSEGTSAPEMEAAPAKPVATEPASSGESLAEGADASQDASADEADTPPARGSEDVAEAAAGETAVEPEESSAARENLAAVEPQETKKPAQPPAQPVRGEAPGPDTSVDVTVEPTFDVVRLDDDGSLLAAGRAAPDAQVALLLNGDVIGTVTANDIGEWLIMPDRPLPPGSHQLMAEASDAAGSADSSSEAITLAVPQRDSELAEAIGERPQPAETDEKGPEQVAAAPDPAPEESIAPQGDDMTAGAPAARQDQPSTDEVEPQPQVAVAPQPEIEPERQVDDVPEVVDAPLALDSVDYNDDGDIVFSGRAGPGQTVRVYVDNQFVGETTADDKGRWQFAGRDQIEPGQHTLRADLLGVTGDVFGRLFLPFVRAGSREVAALIESRREAGKLQETAEAADEADSPESAEAAPEPNAPVMALDPVPEPEPEADIATEEASPGPRSESVIAAEDEAHPESETQAATVAEAAAPRPEPVIAVKEVAPQPEAVIAAEQASPEPEPEDAVVAEKAAPEPEPEPAIVAEQPAPEPAPEVVIVESAAESRPDVVVMADPVAADPEPKIPDAAGQTAAMPEPGTAKVPMAQPAQTSKPAAVAALEDKPAPEAAKAGHVVIQPGNNLWRISRVIYGRGIAYTAIYEANRHQIRDPDLIYPGQIFATPGVNPPSEIDPDRRTPMSPEELARRGRAG